jgi:hypothetical protein
MVIAAYAVIYLLPAALPLLWASLQEALAVAPEDACVVPLPPVVRDIHKLAPVDGGPVHARQQRARVRAHVRELSARRCQAYSRHPRLAVCLSH